MISRKARVKEVAENENKEQASERKSFDAFEKERAELTCKPNARLA